MIFQLRSTIPTEPFVRFGWFFCKLLTISFPFQIKTGKFLKNSKFRNIFENIIFDQKTTLQKLARRSINDCQIWNQRPIIREVQYFSRGAKFFYNQCYVWFVSWNLNIKADINFYIGETNYTYLTLCRCILIWHGFFFYHHVRILQYCRQFQKSSLARKLK